MKISQETRTILKNFTNFTKGILFKAGSKQFTRTESVVVEAVVRENFPLEVGIFDLGQLLNVIDLFNDPELDFTPQYLRIFESDGSGIETQYVYAAPGLIFVPYPKKKSELPADVIEFNLTEEQWSKIQKATSILQRTEFKIVSDGKVVRMGTANHKNEQGSSFSMVLNANTRGFPCHMVYSRDHLQLLKGSYQGIIAPTYTVFKNTSGYDLTYYIGAEPTSSTFGNDENE